MDILECADYLDNATLIKHGIVPSENKPQLENTSTGTDEPSPGLKTKKPTRNIS
jgi:hypothetical protein